MLERNSKHHLLTVALAGCKAGLLDELDYINLDEIRGSACDGVFGPDRL
jgi:hypothetical protein